MNSRVNNAFWKAFRELPAEVQEKAREVYRLWRHDPLDPGLRFKCVHEKLPIYPIRIGIHWRVLCVTEGDTVVWFWIGSQADYDRIISRI